MFPLLSTNGFGVGVVTRVPDEAVIAAFTIKLVVRVASGQSVIAGAAEQQIEPALAQ